ncbi:hypothetical protein [Rudaea cellulosilytica]|uniref:hypothetical protein n=1 Tax=Rudaea cellulosilytica TaxID=540746 RepID=UPI0012F96B00|nr:hypothetical protein [Rudaea cellulosilytica]
MYDQSKPSGLIQFARVDACSAIIDVYPGDGFGPDSSLVCSFVPAEVATQPADVLWLQPFYHDFHNALIQAGGASDAQSLHRIEPGPFARG